MYVYVNQSLLCIRVCSCAVVVFSCVHIFVLNFYMCINSVKVHYLSY